MAAPLSDLLVGMDKGRKKGPFRMNPEVQKAFESLCEALIHKPVLIHFNLEKPILVQTDASSQAIAGIMLQPPDNDLMST